MRSYLAAWLAMLCALIALSGCEARVNRQRDHMGFLEIHKAARDGDIASVRKLIENGAKVNAPDLDGITPLHTAAKNNDIELATLLLRHHADPAMTTSDGWEAIHLAAWKGHQKMVETLMSYGASASRATPEGWTPVHLAAFKGSLPILDTIYRDWSGHGPSGKPDPNALDQEGLTPLLLALQQGHPVVTSFLVQRGAKPDLADSTGNTALHLAARYDDLEAVRALLTAGADANARNDAGMTPLGVAMEAQRAAVAELIWQVGGRQ